MIVLGDSKEEQAAFWKTLKANLFKGTDVFTVLFFFSFILVSRENLLVAQYVQFFVTPWTITRQALLSMGFPRQEYWSGLPFPSPGNLPDPGMKPSLDFIF